MREIKFRVYDKQSNQMIYLDTPKTFDNGLWFQSEQHIDSNDIVIMQYTGLKDVDEKEIYENDIVEGYVYIFSTDFAGNDRHGKTLKKGYVYYDLETLSFNINFDDSIDFLTEFENIKIIGNIYENKEFGV